MGCRAMAIGDDGRPAGQGRRNARVLALCQGLYTCAISVDLTLTGLVGYRLAPDKALATLPFALITVVGAVVTLFAALLMGRIGRRLGFALGAASGAAGGVISVWAVLHGSFWGFCAGTGAVGAFQAFAQYYRLAAADSVATAAKSRAISTVLAGGVIAALLGPAMANWSRHLLPSSAFAGAYLAVALLGGLSVAVLLALYRDVEPASGHDAPAGPARPLAVVLAQPIFLAALANSVAGSAAMMLVMTAAPLAAVAAHHSIDQGAGIIQWHLVGMYAPSLAGGWIVRRFGLGRMLAAGMALMLACAAAAVTSTGLPAFYAALLFLGVGWNFMMIGGTTLLARSYAPAERARTQGVAELIRYGVTALASLAAGAMLEHAGWAVLNEAVVPLIALAALTTLWWQTTERRAAAVQSVG